ncbi:non-structural maintenance of chromosomes element 3 homolog [Hyla sarda]|uniref:non-structural maintenance of chromosomes element 3 homolog n=1 Tax=Hyla sarda TaxID=327740 RepID=UPI0024C2E414|nr:non-structural maintenance of chromosomes element 3 homolog [Hyla sarda]XP_056396241.1 non-structural maintenance of chromosomes element 3 homolog [Hyla sarda]XP_056396242.1 non-structural maintenance of chromosomes element 3 homolog [Hyla sarda]
MAQKRRGRPSLRNTSQVQRGDVDMEEDISFTQTQTLTQVQRNLEKHSPEQVNLKVGELVQYLLIRDQKKLPIKRADIVKHVVKDYKDVYPEILHRAQKALLDVFGFQLEEIDTKSHIYILINKLERVPEDSMKVDDNTAKLGLLTVILSLIFMKGNSVKEAVIWETLRRLHVDPGERHEDFGDVRKLVTDEFVKQKYLEYNKIPHTDPPECEFRWGPRACKETSKMKILDFVSKIQQKEPKSWITQYKDAQELPKSQAPTASQSARP